MLNLHSDYNNAVAYLQMKKIYAEEMENLQGSYNAGNMIINLDIDSVLEECNSYWYLVCNQGFVDDDLEQDFEIFQSIGSKNWLTGKKDEKVDQIP